MSWKKKKLVEACTIRPPKSVAKKLLLDDDSVSFLGMEHLGINEKFTLPNIEKKLAEVSGSYTYFAENDVLLAKITPCFENGKLGIAKNLTNNIGFGSSEFIVFRTNEELSNEWLYYFLSRHDFLKDGANYMSGAVGHKRINKDFIENYEIPLPPIVTQQKIVTKLDAIFAEISKATAAAEANAKNAEALFESYLRQVFEEEGKEWQTTKVSELGRVQSGGTPSISKKEYWGNEIEWFSSGELNDLYTLASIRRITLDGIKNSNAKVFPINSLLIGMYDTAAMKMSLLSNPAAFNQAVVGIEPTEKLNMVFLYYALAYIKPYVLSLRRGVRQKNLSLAKIKDLFIQIPKNIDIQNEVAERLNFFKDTTNKLKIGYLEKINQNIKLKNSILKQAFNGALVKE